MKKHLALFLAMLICMGVLCSCGKDAPDGNDSVQSDSVVSKTDDTDLYPVQEQEEIDNIETQYEAAISADKIGGTYWKAVRFEGEGSAEGGDEMPMGSWDADIFFNEDGTGRFRNTYGASYNYFQPECEWSFDEGTSRLLIKLTDGSETYIHGLFTENGLRIDYNEGYLWFEQSDMPPAGGEWCLADLVGTWKLDAVEIEGYKYSAEEEGVQGSISFFFNDPELNANYVNYDDFGNRTEFVDAMVVYQDMPLVDGFVNEAWCVELIEDDDSIKCYAALTDRENLTVIVEYYDEEFEYPAVSVQFFTWEGTESVG